MITTNMSRKGGNQIIPDEDHSSTPENPLFLASIKEFLESEYETE